MQNNMGLVLILILINKILVLIY